MAQEVALPPQDAPAIASLNALSNEQIRAIANTEIVPRHLRGNPMAMVATILKGRALGLDDIHSLTAIHFIDGRATLSGETMIALVRSHGHSISWELEPGVKVTARGKRKDTGDEGSVTWTLQQAKDAGLTSKDNWKRYPDTMLTWRAISQLCRFLFGDVLMGVTYTEDEAHEASERGRVTEVVSDLPVVEEQKVRTESLNSASEAQLNRIARLEERAGSGYQLVLQGVFGVNLASELNEDAAAQYEQYLIAALPPESEREVTAGGGTGSEPVVAEGSTPSSPTSRSEQNPDGPVVPSTEVDEDAATTEEPSVDPDNHAAVEPGPEGSVAVDDPEPVEEVDGEVVEEEPVEPRLVELAGETIIPLGTNRGTALSDIHDGWLAWALRNTGKFQAPFVDALELYVRETKPELWEKERS